MKAIKRTVAALLATLMLATSTSFTLAAETYTDDEAVVVAKVQAAGIMQGTDKGFEPSKTLTRAEAAAIIVRMKGISESAVKTAAGTTLFNDVAASHWASGYINQASNTGIVKGVSATEFAPDREVTVAEFATMAIRALGAGQLVDSEGTWPTNYVNFANENGILDDVNVIYTATASRMNAATIVANTLKAPMWEKVGVKSNGEIEWGKAGYTVDAQGKVTYKTIVTNVLKLTEDTITVSEVSNNNHKLNGNKKVNEKFDLTNIKVGLTYKCWKDEDGVITGLWLDEEDTVNFTAIAKCTKAGKIKLVVNGEEMMYTVATKDEDGDAITVTYSLNEEIDYGNVASLTSKNENIFGTAYLNDDDEIVALYATQYDNYAVVDEVKDTKVKMNKDVKGGDTSTITLDVEDNEYFLTKDGNAMNFADLEEGDAIAYYTISIDGGKKFVGEVVTNVVEGKVTAAKDKVDSSSNDYQSVKIGGSTYDVLASLFSSKIKVGDEIEAWLNPAGKIVMFRKVESKSASEVALISYFKPYTDKYGWSNADVKLTFLDGTTSDELTIDVKGSIKEIYEAKNVKEDADDEDKFNFDDKDGDPASVEYADLLSDNNIALGKVVCYSISGSKVTFKGLSEDDDEEFYTVANSESLTVAKKTAKISEVIVANSTASPAVTSYTNVYVTENTKFIKVKADGTYGRKVEILSYDDLDDVTTFHGDSYVVNYDEDDKEVDAVIFGIGSTITKSGDANFAYITEVREAEDVDDENALEVDVIYLDGKKATLTAIDGTTTDFSDVDDYEGLLVDLTVNDDVISSIDAMADNGTDDFLTELIDGTTIKEQIVDKYVASRDEITFKKFSAGNDIAADQILADDVLVVLTNSARDKFTVKSVSDLEEYADSTTKYVKVQSVVTLDDVDEHSTEIVFVLYTVEDKTEITTYGSGLTTATNVSVPAAIGSYYGKVELGVAQGYVGKVEVKSTDSYHDTLVYSVEAE